MSELALGPHGWAMFIAFSFLALSAAGVQIIVGSAGGSKSLRWVLAGAALFFLAAGAFPLGRNSELHILAIAVAFVLSVLAIYLFPSMAGQASALLPKSVSWSLAGGVAVSVALGHSVLPMGAAQRLAAACLLLWFGAVALQAIRLNTQPFRPRQ